MGWEHCLDKRKNNLLGKRLGARASLRLLARVLGNVTLRDGIDGQRGGGVAAGEEGARRSASPPCSVLPVLFLNSS